MELLRNKLLLNLHFIIQYIGGNNLACLFNVFNYYITKVLNKMLPYLVEFFILFVPNKKINKTHSRLHNKIKYIIDTTIHKTQRKHDKIDTDFNGHYKIHGKLTQILLDYHGVIVVFLTNIKGKTHDSLVATYNKHFKRIVGSDLTLGDLGFNGINYIVAGFKPSSLSTWEQHIFDTISRREQVLIENTNKNIKENKSINKTDTFRHNESRLLACICVSIGLYNLKLSWGYYK